jgi:hypothetical protein
MNLIIGYSFDLMDNGFGLFFELSFGINYFISLGFSNRFPYLIEGISFDHNIFNELYFSFFITDELVFGISFLYSLDLKINYFIIMTLVYIIVMNFQNNFI